MKLKHKKTNNILVILPEGLNPLAQAKPTGTMLPIALGKQEFWEDGGFLAISGWDDGNEDTFEANYYMDLGDGTSISLDGQHVVDTADVTWAHGEAWREGGGRTRYMTLPDEGEARGRIVKAAFMRQEGCLCMQGARCILRNALLASWEICAAVAGPCKIFRPAFWNCVGFGCSVKFAYELIRGGKMWGYNCDNGWVPVP